MSVEDFRSFYKTFNLIFPNNVGFANIKYDEDTPVKFETSEILIIGSQKEIDLSKIDLNYKNLPIESKQYLDGLRLSSGEEISHLLLFTDEQIQGYAENAEIVTDDKPILEFSTAKKVLMQDPRAVIEDINNFLEDDE
jgi:hypothetical protein